METRAQAGPVLFFADVLVFALLVAVPVQVLFQGVRVAAQVLVNVHLDAPLARVRLVEGLHLAGHHPERGPVPRRFLHFDPAFRVSVTELVAGRDETGQVLAVAFESGQEQMTVPVERNAFAGVDRVAPDLVFVTVEPLGFIQLRAVELVGPYEFILSGRRRGLSPPGRTKRGKYRKNEREME